MQKEAAGGAGEEVKALAPEVLKRVEALSRLQEEFAEQHKAFVEEYKALQLKYQAIHADLYVKRADVVSGKVDPAEAGEGKSKGIEGFWLQAMQNGRNTGGTIEEHDEPVLKALTVSHRSRNTSQHAIYCMSMPVPRAHSHCMPCEICG